MELGFLSIGLVWGGLMALLLVGGVSAGHLFSGRPLAAVPIRSTRQLLDEQLARGEIGQDEYERILARIRA